MKILLAVDKSRQAKEAARAVRDCFPGSEIELVHVLDIEAAPHSHLSAALIDEEHRKIRSRLWTDANRFLPKFVALFARIARKVRVLVREGPASDLILQMASVSPPDLIVLGSRIDLIITGSRRREGWMDIECFTKDYPTRADFGAHCAWYRFRIVRRKTPNETYCDGHAIDGCILAVESSCIRAAGE